MGTPASLSRDGVAALISELSARFASQHGIRRAVLSVLEPLQEGWSAHPQGMTKTSFDELEAALLSPLEALRVVDVSQAAMAVDQLSFAWERIRDRSPEWVG